MGHRITIICDVCESEYLMEEGMELPPYWLGVQIAVGDSEGEIPAQTRDLLLHFCSLDCLHNLAENSQVRARLALIDKIAREEKKEEEDEDN